MDCCLNLYIEEREGVILNIVGSTQKDINFLLRYRWAAILYVIVTVWGPSYNLLIVTSMYMSTQYTAVLYQGICNNSLTTSQ